MKKILFIIGIITGLFAAILSIWLRFQIISYGGGSDIDNLIGILWAVSSITIFWGILDFSFNKFQSRDYLKFAVSLLISLIILTTGTWDWKHTR